MPGRLSKGWRPAACAPVGRTHQYGFVNNLSAIPLLEDVLFYLQKFDELARPLSCFLNRLKTRILTSCNGQSILPLLQATRPDVAASLQQALETYSVRSPAIPDPARPTIPVELTDGFPYLGSPIGSPEFANRFFNDRLADVNNQTQHLHANFSDHQTRLRCYHQCTSQKLPCLLGADVMHNLPLDFNAAA